MRKICDGVVQNILFLENKMGISNCNIQNMNLYAHRRIHTKEKLRKVFSHNSNLHVHQRINTIENS